MHSVILNKLISIYENTHRQEIYTMPDTSHMHFVLGPSLIYHIDLQQSCQPITQQRKEKQKTG